MCLEAMLCSGGPGIGSLPAGWVGVTSQLADLRGDHGLCYLREVVMRLGFPETLTTRELVPRGADELPFGDRISLVLV